MDPRLRPLFYRLKYNPLRRRWLPFAVNRGWAYLRLMRMHRPIGAFLLLWPTLWALWLASNGRPSPKLFVVFVVGVFVMRSAGCVMNDFADRNFDPYVTRTRGRPLATREVSVREALGLFLVLLALGAVLVLMLNRLSQLLAIIGALLILTYPYMKRYTYLPQPYLGLAFGWGVPMAYAAASGRLPAVAWLIFIGNILWATVYDTQYAMVDRPDDLKIGVKSTAILFGDLDRLIVAVLQLLLLADLALVGQQTHMSAVYYVGLGFALLFAMYQQLLMRKREARGCFRAFMNNNWFGAAVFAGILLHYTFVASV